MDMNGKVALVTGATSGIGRATALRFADAGARVVATGRRALLGEELVGEIEKRGGVASFIAANAANAADAEATVKVALDNYGRLDYAFNNAGLEGQLGLVTDFAEENYEKVFDINVRGVFLSLKYQIPAILESGGGAIVNNASVGGLVGMANVSTYSASKHAVIGITRSTALEWSSQGVRINAVCPAAIQTEMYDRFTGDSDEMKEYLAKLHPIGRIGEANEVADAVLYLCSPAASFVTGHAFPVDGGFTAQ